MTNKSKIEILTPVNIIGFILTMMAGWIDAVGLKLFIKERSSSMSGRAALLSIRAFNKDIKLFMIIAIIILSFMVGACISTLITKKKGLTGGLCFAGILVIIAAFFVYESEVTIATILIPMAMGGQNAATSLTPIRRTTHLTGPTTDIGISIATGDWNTVVFWALHWIAFPTGAIIGLNLVGMVQNNVISTSTTLIIPAIIIILTGIIQKLIFNIPLLDK